MNMLFNRKRVLVSGICVALSIGIQFGETCHAQTTSHPGANALPTAESILDRHVEATGGKQAQLEVKATILTGRWANDLGGHKFEADITVTAVAPDKRHIAIQHPRFNMVRATNGQQAWEWRANDAGNRHTDGAAEMSPGETKWLDEPDRVQTIEAAVFNSHIDWRIKFESTRTAGVAEVNGKPAYEVEVTTRDGEQYSQFYDKECGRLVKTTRTIQSSLLGEYQIETVIERYQEFDGIWLATKIANILHTNSMGEGTQTYEYSDVKLNSDVPATLFEVPAELAEKDNE